MCSKKKPHQECGAEVSGSNICLKEKTVKKAVSAEEPSSDDDTADRISPSAMPLKEGPAKKTVQEEEQLSDDGSSDSSLPNLEKGIFLTKAKLILSRIWFSSRMVYHGRDPVEPRTFPE